jgi:predicted MFS family arabinose efflux permease
MLMASAGAAQAFSTSAGGTIAALVSWRTVFPLLGALAFAVTALLFGLRSRELRLPASQAARPRYRDALRAPQMPALLSLVAFEGMLFMGGFPFLSGLLEQRFQLDVWRIGLILGLAGVSQVAAARLLPALLARATEKALLGAGGSMMGAAYLISAASPHWLGVALGCLLVGAGFSLCHSTLQTRATEAFPNGRGTSLALFAFSLFSGSALGSVCQGYACEWLGYGQSFAIAGVLLFVFTWAVVRALGARVPR